MGPRVHGSCLDAEVRFLQLSLPGTSASFQYLSFLWSLAFAVVRSRLGKGWLQVLSHFTDGQAEAHTWRPFWESSCLPGRQDSNRLRTLEDD